MDCNWLDKYELCFESKEQTAQLIERLADAEKALEFYAKKSSWVGPVGCHIDEIKHDDLQGDELIGGKRAREYFEKWRRE
jgi:hypothetical protein